MLTSTVLRTSNIYCTCPCIDVDCVDKVQTAERTRTLHGRSCQTGAKDLEPFQQYLYLLGVLPHWL